MILLSENRLKCCIFARNYMDMRSFYFYILLSALFVSCSSDETPYSYLSRPDADAEVADIKLVVSDDNAAFNYLIQSTEIYITWGNGAKDTEYILLNKDLIDSVKPIKNIYPKAGEFDIRIKTLGMKKLDLSKTDNLLIGNNAGNSISELTLANYKNIQDLRFSDQPISSVDLTGCTTLITLYCGYAGGIQTITGLDKLKSLETVLVNGSLDTSSIDLTASDSLRSVSVAHSDFKTLKLDGLAAVKTIVLKDNPQLEASALNTLFTALPTAKATGYTITLSGNKGDNDCDRSIATKKGWIFK